MCATLTKIENCKECGDEPVNGTAECKECNDGFVLKDNNQGKKNECVCEYHEFQCLQSWFGGTQNRKKNNCSFIDCVDRLFSIMQI